jgi:hypothetical protein
VITTEYTNCADNSIQRDPDLAIITCWDSKTTIGEMAGRCGIPMHRAVFLSSKDNPGLRTPKAILAALPPSITWMLITNVEFLLPASRRTRVAVHVLVAEFGRLAYPRGIVVNATHDLGSPDSPVVSVHSLSNGAKSS